MRAVDIFRTLGVSDAGARLDRLLHNLDPQAPADWRLLAAALAVRLTSASGDSAGPMRIVGIAGGQGAGKSTLARLLVQALGALGMRAATGSIDDFYLTRAERRTLGERVHPLLATRGVPGTHDVPLCQQILDALSGSGEVALPRFDKGLDDRCPAAKWPLIEAPLDFFVLEGWCLGAVPQPPARLVEPVNALEATEDAEGRWRRFVNDALAGDYAALWARVSFWLYLRVPDMAAVTRWRSEQEQSLPLERRMKPDQLARFVAHYERITRWMFETMPARCDLLARLGDDHRLASLEERGRR